jgi:very-short-patch-repair endonuclease
MKTPRPWQLPRRPTTLATLQAAGVTWAMIRTHVANGSLLRLRDGVYLGARYWPEEQAFHPAAVISHHSAALVWCIPSPPAADWGGLPPRLIVPRDGSLRAQRRPGRSLSVAALPASQVTVDGEGWSITTPERTAVDLARDCDLPGALVVLDSAARLVLAAMVANPRRRDFANPLLLREVRAALAAACDGRRGMKQVLAAIQLVDPRRESPIESLTAGHLALAGLPMPEFQAPIQTAAGMLYPDCLWREHNLVGEADGAGKYRDGEAWVKEREREQLLRDLGFRVVRWLGKEIMWQPAVVMDRIARALGTAL